MNIFRRFINWIKSLFGWKAVSTPTQPGWNFMYSPNMPPAMRGDFFDFPQVDGVHYVVRSSGPIRLGQKITMKFDLEGTGKLIAKDGDPTPRIRILLQQRNDDLATPDARWWSVPLELTGVPGQYTLEAKVEHGQGWITIGGGLPSAGAQGFNACVADLGNIGFSFGGWSAGHGVYAEGPVRFTLREFSVL